jgi:ABC-2 type transport system permease protein
VNAITRFLRRLCAFISRDFKLAVSYKVDFFMKIFSVLIAVISFYFLSRLMVGKVSSAFPEWDDPFLTWLTGFPFLAYFMTGFSSLANAIREEQKQGTLESLLLTPISIPTLIVCSSAWDLIQVTITSFLYFFFGWIFFDAHFKGSFPLAILFLVLTTLVLASLGILSASFAMVFKRGDPFALVLGTGSALFSGVLFPTQLLGSQIGVISKLLPTTYGLYGIRRVLILGESISQVREPLIILLLFLVVLLPFSLWVFERAILRAKREGSLIQF